MYFSTVFIFTGKVIPNDRVHPRLWKGSNRKFRFIPRQRNEIKKQNKVNREWMVEAWGQLPYKSDGGDCRKVWQEPPKGTRILFCGCGSNSFSPQRGTKSWILTPKGYDDPWKSSLEVEDHRKWEVYVLQWTTESRYTAKQCVFSHFSLEISMRDMPIRR